MNEYNFSGKWIYDLNEDLRGSDRSCAVLSGALLDDILKNLLKKYLLKPENEKNDKLFGASSLFGSFALRIELSRRLNLITDEIRNALDSIRRIRNKAAHQADFTFESDSNTDVVSNIVKALALEKRVPDMLKKPYDGSKGNFVAATIVLKSCLAIDLDKITTTSFQPNNALAKFSRSEG